MQDFRPEAIRYINRLSENELISTIDFFRELTGESDPFYSEGNLKAIEESLEQINRGQVVVKTIEELEAMEILQCKGHYGDK